jgi:hypothetical protein
MNPKWTGRRSVHRLFEIRNRFDSAASGEKLRLLRLLGQSKVQTRAEIKRLHTALCFIRAFPDTIAHYRQADAQLASFEKRVGKLPAKARSGLSDSGISGTPIHYEFSYEVASWMARRAAGTVSIDWAEMGEMDDTARLDDLLALLLQPAEEEYFDNVYVSTREWISLAAADTNGTDFDWLLAQLGEERLKPIWSEIYNNAELQLVWDLRGTALSKSLNTMPIASIQARSRGLRKRVRNVKQEIMRPVDALRRLSPRAGSRLIDVAMASMAVRHRETLHFNFANPKEVYLADVGEGVSVAVFGLQQQYRYPLECTMGYLILSNGVPVGYGGASALFRQVNTGINIFDEYRGSEAAFLWVQVMRVYHHLLGCTRFIANPFQFGGENAEALASGAFWFYYRLGYRPVLPAIRKLAQRESKKMRRNKAHRSDARTLRRLASCDMHLTLPGARASDMFDEHWLETSSMLATKSLAATGCSTRAEAADRLAEYVARDLGLRSLSRWTADERLGFSRLAPIVAATNPAAWPADAKRSMRKLLRAKGGPSEADYARLLCKHDYFLSALRASCRHAA